MEKILNKIHLGDSLEFMKSISDKSIDLVLTDPPYGIKQDGGKNKFGVHPNEYQKKDWDRKRISADYFTEIFRISKNQIIFGGNYYTDVLPITKSWLVWDKIYNLRCQNDFSDCELIWTSFSKAIKKYTCVQQGFIKTDKSPRIHPTQKPLPLIQEILADYSKPEEIILDCFSGSGTTALACHNLKLNFICIEQDEDYYKKSVDRLIEYQRQGILL